MRQLLLKRRSLVFPGGLRPGFDPSHPASAGISPGHGLSAIASGATLVNLLNAAKATISGAPTASIDGLIGRTCYAGAGGSTDKLTFAGNSTATDDNMTIAAIWRQVGTPNPGDYLATSSNGSTGWEMQYVTGANNFNIHNHAQATDDNSGYAITAGHAYFGVVSASTSGSGFSSWCLVDLNTGVMNAFTATYPDTAAGWTSSGASNGSYAVGIGNAPLAKIAAIMWGPRCLTLPQQLAWCADPGSFWYPTPINCSSFDPAFGAKPAGGASFPPTGFIVYP